MAFYTKIHLNQAFMAKTSCSCMYRGDFGKILCVEQRGPPPPTPPSRQLGHSVARWSKFRPKSSKGAEKKKLDRRIHGWNLAKCSQKWQKRGWRKFSKEILFSTVMTNTQRQWQSSIFISNCGFSWTLHWCFCEIGRSFPKLAKPFSKLAELFWCTGRNNFRTYKTAVTS